MVEANNLLEVMMVKVKGFSLVKMAEAKYLPQVLMADAKVFWRSKYIRVKNEGTFNQFAHIDLERRDSDTHFGLRNFSVTRSDLSKQFSVTRFDKIKSHG